MRFPAALFGLAAAGLFAVVSCSPSPADDTTEKRAVEKGAPEAAASPEIVLVAGETPPKDHVRPRVYLSCDRLPAGRACRIAIVIDVEEGWHVNTNPARPDFLIPTTVAVRAEHGTKAAGLTFPPGKNLAVAGFDEPLSVYDGRVVVLGTLEVPKEAAGQTEELTVEVKFQACNDANCLPPKTTKLVGKVPVAGPTEPVKTINEEIFDPRKRKGA